MRKRSGSPISPGPKVTFWTTFRERLHHTCDLAHDSLLNRITKPDSFPLSRVDDLVDHVGSAKFVTKLDLLKGYWQVPLTTHASEICTFVTPDHFLQYTVMPFGLRNAPATFQQLMNTVLCGVRNCDVYLDDIVAHSSTWSEHLDTFREVFTRLLRASLTLNLAKCEFGPW